MCGICGMLSYEGNAEARVRISVSRMVRHLRHRGPDDEGTHLAPVPHADSAHGWLGLGHTRLSIIDLSAAGRQPMANEDGSLWLVFNGEIYNFQELRSELVARGHRFQSATDSEVLLHLYEEEGEDFLLRCNGMFAFALWDGTRQRLLLARDRLGVKPLVYARLPQGVAFASDVRALIQTPGLSVTVSPSALLDYLTLGYVLTPRTIFAEIERLPAGHLLVFEAGAARPRRYWAPRIEPRSSPARSDASYMEELDELLKGAVERRLISDVPLGAFLSGGLDSSAVTAEAIARGGRAIQTFSIAFPEASYDELPAARRTAQHLGSPHFHTTVPTEADAIRNALVHVLDEPLGDTSLVPMYYLARLARERVTVALSGDGGDEAFGGYETYRADRLFQWYRKIPPPLRSAVGTLSHFLPVTPRKVGLSYKLRQFLSVPGDDGDRAHFWWRVVFPLRDAQGILRPEFWSGARHHDPFETFASHAIACGRPDSLSRFQYVDLKTFLSDCILVKVDRATMAHALEARSPFLDFRLIEWALSLPDHLKVQGSEQKVLLRRLVGKRLPASTLRQPKRGFNAPVSAWLKGPLREMATELFGAASLRSVGFFDPSAVASLWSAHLRGWQDQGFRLWVLFTFLVWWHNVARQRPEGTG